MPNRVTINGSSYNIPASIEEITIRKFIEYRQLEPKDLITVIGWAIPELDVTLITNNNKKVERELANTITLLNVVLEEMYTFMASPERKTAVPSQIDFMGWKIALAPGLLTSLPYWPYIQVKNIIQQEAKKPQFDPTDRIPEILAHYLYSAVTKSKYNEEKAEAFIYVVDEMPMVEAIQVGNFFLLKYKSLYLSRTSSFLTNLHLLRLRLKSRFSKNIATLTRWRPSRAATS